MSEAVGIRLEDDLLIAIDSIGKIESTGRSTTVRSLLKLGLAEYKKRKAKEQYIAGDITLNEAARIANITV